MANERTFLAWIRTSLALMAGGVGIEALNAAAERTSAPRTALAVLLLATGVACSAGAFTRWLVTERALRREAALPPPRMAPVLGYGLAALGIIACVLLLTTDV